MYCVYKHTTPNGKVYIGITGKNPIVRWKCGNGYKRNKHFYNAINKYGWGNITHEILFEGLTKDDACKKEIELISIYNSNKYENGYNSSSGGECSGAGVECTKEHREKTRKSLTGHTVTEETREKLRVSSKMQKNRSHPPIMRGADNKKSRKVVAYKENGQEEISFVTVSEAAKYFGVCHQSISDCCSGRIHNVKGIKFRYESEVT